MMATAVQSSPMPTSPNSSKRKRGLNDHDNSRNVKQQTASIQDNTVPEPNYAALLQSVQDPLQGHDNNAQTAQAALNTSLPQSHYPHPDPFDSSQLTSFDDPTSGAAGMPNASTAQQLYDARMQTQKPAVGSTAWHQQRKDNHKEVERRRREVINEGIENIAKIVPGTEKNKGAILGRTCAYIQELQTKIAAFDAERATFDHTLSELTSRHDRMKESAQRAWQESSKWQQRCREAGLSFDDYDDATSGLTDGLDTDGLDTDGLDTDGLDPTGGVS